MTDFDLLERWRAGDKAAGEDLFNRYFHQVYRFVFRLVSNKTDTEDLVQETFLACVKGRDTFRRESSFRTYLFAIATHVVHQCWRHRRTRPTVDDVDLDLVESLSTSIGQRLSRHEDAALLLEALRILSPDPQLLIALRFWEEMETSELAREFGVEEATIRSRLFRAREQLSKHFEDLKACAQHDGVDPRAFEDWAREVRSARKTADDGGSASSPASCDEDSPERSRG